MELLSAATSIISLLFFLIFLYKFLCTSRKAQPPKAAGAWPIIGHLHLLGGPELPHIVLGSMAEKYGPVFTINLGLRKALIVGDSRIVKECFTTNDKAFASRPKSAAVKLMGYNYAVFGLSPYGPYWRQMRKTVVHELLSDTRIETFAHRRVSEVKMSIKEMHDFWVKKSDGGKNVGMVKVEMKQWFGNLTLNMVVNMLVGKRFSQDDEEGHISLKAIRRFAELLGTFVVSDYIPFLWFVDFAGHEKTMKIHAKELDSILDGWLQDHKKHARDHSHDQERDFMDILLSSVSETNGFDADTCKLGFYIDS